MYLKWAPNCQYRTIVIKLRSKTPTLDKRVARSRLWLFLPDRAWDIILGSGRERARAKKSSSLYSVCLGFLNWNETASDLLMSEDVKPRKSCPPDRCLMWHALASRPTYVTCSYHCGHCSYGPITLQPIISILIYVRERQWPEVTGATTTYRLSNDKRL